MIIASFKSTKVDGSAGGGVKVIANDEVHPRVVDDCNVLQVEEAARQIEEKINAKSDEANTTDAAELPVANTVSDTLLVHDGDTLGMFAEK